MKSERFLKNVFLMKIYSLKENCTPKNPTPDNLKRASTYQIQEANLRKQSNINKRKLVSC